MQTKEIVRDEQYIATRSVTRTLYIAEDGRTFSDEIKCLEHEEILKLAELYIKEPDFTNSEKVSLIRLLFSSEDESDCVVLNYKFTKDSDIVNKLHKYIGEKYDVKALLDNVNDYNEYNEGDWVYLFYWTQYKGSNTWEEFNFKHVSADYILTILDDLKQKI